jgi:hypothetical protein
VELKGFEPSTSALRTNTPPGADPRESPHERETGETRATAGATDTCQWLAELAEVQAIADPDLAHLIDCFLRLDAHAQTIVAELIQRLSNG